MPSLPALRRGAGYPKPHTTGHRLHAYSVHFGPNIWRPSSRHAPRDTKLKLRPVSCPPTPSASPYFTPPAHTQHATTLPCLSPTPPIIPPHTPPHPSPTHSTRYHTTTPPTLHPTPPPFYCGASFVHNKLASKSASKQSTLRALLLTPTLPAAHCRPCLQSLDFSGRLARRYIMFWDWVMGTFRPHPWDPGSDESLDPACGHKGGSNTLGGSEKYIKQKLG